VTLCREPHPAMQSPEQAAVDRPVPVAQRPGGQGTGVDVPGRQYDAEGHTPEHAGSLPPALAP
jgi:hypothetical protein